MSLMTTTTARPLLSPEEIAARAGHQVTFLRLPERATVFAEREMRLRQLAAAHPMRDFLLFTAELARAQHLVLQAYPALALPDQAALEAAARAGQAPLPALLWPRDAAWRSGLRLLLEELLARVPDSPARDAVGAAQAMPDTELEQQAGRLLHGIMTGLDMRTAPLVAAGLQTCFTHMVTALEAMRGSERQAPFGRTVDATLCPCCASLPTASVVQIDPGGGTCRYLHCSLCSAHWHMVRIKCSHCEGTKGIHYYSLQTAEAAAAGAPVSAQAVETEICEGCGHYLKIVRADRDRHVEAVADDLATVTLDLLTAEAGYQRHGVNLLLLYGDEDAASGPMT
jgi:FdhE protein